MSRRGFTLLEMLVATTIMGIAVAGVLSTLSTSMRNASRLTDFDRAALLARAKTDELLVERRLPRNADLRGPIDPALLGGAQGGWRARLTLLEAPPIPNPPPHVRVMDRLEVEIWWMAGERRRSFRMEAYRTGPLDPLVTP